jgi:Trp operon repressor
MVQLSKQKLDPDLDRRIHILFYQLLTSIHSQDDFQRTFIGVLSPIELTVLARRMAIFLLLVKKIDREHIHQVLKVSNATISKYAMILENNKDVQKRFDQLADMQHINLFLRQLIQTIFYPGRPYSSWSAALSRKHALEKEKAQGI